MPCPNLQPDQRCGIHDSLRDKGFPGCEVYDCFGAGQHLVQVVLGGRGSERAAVLAALPVARALHELLWLLLEAEERGNARLGADAVALRAEVEAAAADPLASDVDALRGRAGVLLEAVSEQVRRPAGPDRRGADLVGADLRATDLRRSRLRGALLLGADLRGADLRESDLLGTDLRGADLRGADLQGALFLTVPQLRSARGDATTAVPDWAERPDHWG